MRRLLAVAALIAAASVPPAGAAPPGAPGAPPAPAFTPRPPASAGLPEAVGAWRLSGAPRVLLPDQLYEYMDGGADLYLGYRFKRLELREYAAPDRDPIVVEAYRMETPDDAYGLLSLD